MRIAVLSDIHANLVALEAILAATGSVDAIWQLGDIVGYGPEPNGVVTRLREAGATGVRGNHDAAALGGLSIEMFNVDARQAMEWTRLQLSDATRGWLTQLPEVNVIDDWTLVHGSLRDPMWEYVTSTSSARGSIARLTTAFGLHGHTHVPIAFRDDDGRIEVLGAQDGTELTLDDRPVFLNPGSVGQPRDGLPDASSLIIDTDAGTARWQRVPYDVAAVQASMADKGLPRRLVERLSFGL